MQTDGVDAQAPRGRANMRCCRPAPPRRRPKNDGMLSDLSPTDVAFSMVALMQGVLALVWLVGAWMGTDARRAALHWAAFAALSALSFALLTLALHRTAGLPAELWRACGNLSGVLAFVALHRGIWLFTGRPLALRAHALALGIALIAAYVGLWPGGGGVRVSVTSGVLALLAVAMAVDLYRHVRDVLHLRWPALMALPLFGAALGLGYRGVRAALWPATVSSEMTINSALNVRSTFAYVVIALAFHATLMALVVGRLVVDLRNRSRHDGLTGLLNRRAIEESMQAQIRRSQRTGETFTVLMLDLDHFKTVNDRFGHAAGDRALRHAAGLLKGCLRDIDSLARIGGEEFLALMPGLDLVGAQPVAERLRAQLADHPMPLAQTRVALSVSIGIAQWAHAGEDPSRVMVRADAALYQAKVQGRNRVVAATPHGPTLSDAAAGL